MLLLYQKKQDEFDEGINITPDRLILLAVNKYKTMIENGTYNKLSAEEEKIIALQAQIKKQVKGNKKGEKDSKDNKNNNTDRTKEKEDKRNRIPILNG